MPQSAYDVHFWDGGERFTMGWFENLLTQQWIPAMPDVQAKLKRGALVGGGLRARARPHQDGVGVSQVALRGVRHLPAVG